MCISVVNLPKRILYRVPLRQFPVSIISMQCISSETGIMVGIFGVKTGIMVGIFGVKTGIMVGIFGVKTGIMVGIFGVEMGIMVGIFGVKTGIMVGIFGVKTASDRYEVGWHLFFGGKPGAFCKDIC